MKDEGFSNARDESFEKSLNAITEQTDESLIHWIQDAWDADFMGQSFPNGSYSAITAIVIITVSSSCLIIVIHYSSSTYFDDEYGLSEKELSCYPQKYISAILFFGHNFTDFTQIMISLSFKIRIDLCFVLIFLLINCFAFKFHLSHLFTLVTNNFTSLQILKIQQYHR